MRARLRRSGRSLRRTTKRSQRMRDLYARFLGGQRKLYLAPEQAALVEETTAPLLEELYPES